MKITKFTALKKEKVALQYTAGNAGMHEREFGGGSHAYATEVYVATGNGNTAADETDPALL